MAFELTQDLPRYAEATEEEQRVMWGGGECVQRAALWDRSGQSLSEDIHKHTLQDSQHSPGDPSALLLIPYRTGVFGAGYIK